MNGNHIRAYLLVIGIYAVLSGCATSTNSGNPTPAASSLDISGETLPAVTVFLLRGSDELVEKCDEYNVDNFSSSCDYNSVTPTEFAKTLRETGQFAGVEVADDQVEYQIGLTIATFDNTEAKELGQAVLAGATLLLIPMTVDKIANVEAQIGWRGQLLKSFSYEVPISVSASLFGNNVEEKTRSLLQDISARVVRDIRQTQVLSGEFLANTLNSSNYSRDLKYPQTLGNFQFSELLVRRNPMAGAVLSYTDPDLENDFLDVFVYPIRSVNFEAPESALDGEIDSLQKELELEQRDLIGTRPETEAAQRLAWPSASGTMVPGRASSLIVTNEENQEFKTDLYVFAMGDKIVHIRTTYPMIGRVPNSEPLARQLIANIQVPEESLFMARVRQAQRRNTIQQ